VLISGEGSHDHLRKPQIIVALIGVGAIIIAALIGIIPSLRDHKPAGDRKTASNIIAGTVVDERENTGIGQAAIVIAGRDEKYITDDAGNFRIEVGQDAPKTLRLYVSKRGYQTRDTTVTPPADSLVLQLHKQ
jgi:uncharacterized membrane protein